MATTKWDVLQSRIAAARETLAKLEAEVASLERTEFGEACAGCGLLLVTEADFAKHFVIPDLRFLNIGACPVVKL